MDKNIFDYESLLEQYDEDLEFVNILLQTYLDETPAILSEMDESFASNNQEAMTRTAHSMKSSAANIKAEATREIAMKLEECSKNGRSDECDQLHAQLLEANKVLVENVKEKL